MESTPIHNPDDIPNHHHLPAAACRLPADLPAAVESQSDAPDVQDLAKL
jgi:hypothetical protein